MSKAEKFISDCTKNYSNEIAHWCEEDTSIYSPWLTPDQARRAVEIAREEMIERACSFISDNMAEYIDIKGYTCDTFIDIESDRFINDLKQAMKDE